MQGDSPAPVYLHTHIGVTVWLLLPESKAIADCEELVIHAATAISNLSYYKVRSSAVQDKKLHIAESKAFKLFFLVCVYTSLEVEATLAVFWPCRKDTSSVLWDPVAGI